ncbi:NACHT domain-containing protein [Thermosporothrix hazakensis]|uniref:NACHT domain-containing protein n=2 Tax=Thermosporothrix hazakensis TaxID=644383 RepID=A0A326TWH8_THEHA|nr:NACHT domain-containing protein [Thermosporothrix hazakensis]
MHARRRNTLLQHLQDYIEHLSRVCEGNAMDVRQAVDEEKLMRLCAHYQPDEHVGRYTHACLFSPFPDSMERAPLMYCDLFLLPGWQMDLQGHFRLAKEKYERLTTVPLSWEEVRERFSRIVLIGKHGAGKSWLLSRECARACRRMQQDLAEGREEERFILPVWLHLGELAEVLDLCGGNVLFAVKRLLFPHERVDWFEKWIQTRPTLFLLDGYEQVRSCQREAIRKALLWCEALPHAQLILAVRPDAVPELSLRQAASFELLAWTPEQQRQALLQHFAPSPQLVEALSTVLENDEQWSDLVGLPLVLRWWSAFFEAHQRFPHTLFEGYSWSLMQGAEPDLNDEDVWDALELLAWSCATASEEPWRHILSREEILIVLRQRMGKLRAEHLFARLEANHLLHACDALAAQRVPGKQWYSWASPLVPCLCVARLLKRQQWLWSDIFFSDKRYHPAWQEAFILLAGDAAPAVLRWIEEQCPVLPQDTASLLLFVRICQELSRAGLQLPVQLAQRVCEALLQLDVGSRNERRQAYALMKQCFGHIVRARALQELQEGVVSPSQLCASLLALGIVGKAHDLSLLERIALGRWAHASVEMRCAALLSCVQLDMQRAIVLSRAILRQGEVEIPLCGWALWIIGLFRVREADAQVNQLLQRRAQAAKELPACPLWDAQDVGRLVQWWLHPETRLPAFPLLDEVLLWATVRLCKRTASLPEELWPLLWRKPSLLPVLLREMDWEEHWLGRVVREWLQTEEEHIQEALRFLHWLQWQPFYPVRPIFQAMRAVTKETAIRQALDAWFLRQEEERLQAEQTREKERVEAPLLLTQLLDRSRSRWERISLLHQLQKHAQIEEEERLLPLFLERDEDVRIREMALVLFWRHAGERSWDYLLRLVDDETEEQEIRQCATQCLIKQGPQQDALFESFLWDTDEKIRGLAAQRLGERNATMVGERLGEMLLTEGEHETYSHLCNACAVMRDASAQEYFRTFLLKKEKQIQQLPTLSLSALAEYVLARHADLLSAEAVWYQRDEVLWPLIRMLLQREYEQVAHHLQQRWIGEDEEEVFLPSYYLLQGSLGAGHVAERIIAACWERDEQAPRAAVDRVDALFGLAALGGSLLRNTCRRVCEAEKSDR